MPNSNGPPPHGPGPPPGPPRIRMRIRWPPRCSRGSRGSPHASLCIVVLLQVSLDRLSIRVVSSTIYRRGLDGKARSSRSFVPNGPGRSAAGRNETPDPLRQDALDPGFHWVRAGPAHPGRGELGVDGEGVHAADAVAEAGDVGAVD